MGGGASKEAAKATEESKWKSLRRRRRLLFGGDDARPFESVGPREQFRAPLEDPNSLVLQRLGNCSDLQLKFETIQREGDEGFLRDHVLEHLPFDPRLPPTQPILRRLFHLAQAQLLALPRRKLLTCYEVLALYALVTRGSAEEFLELLFCVFDADGDDQVGLFDLEASMDAFLQLPEAMELPGSQAKEIRTLDARKRNTELRLLAKKALQDFAMDDSEDEEPPKPLEAAVEVPESTEKSPDTPKASAEAEQMSTSSKVAEVEGFPEPKAKPKGGGCCSKPKETPEERAAKEAKQAEAKLKREQEAKEKADKAAAEKQRKEKEAKAKAKAKGGKGRQSAASAACLCGPARKLRLSFRQWLRWLLSLELLPPKLAAAAQTLSAPKVVDGAGHGGGSIIQPPSGHVVQNASQGGQTPAYGQSPTQSEETPDDSPVRGPSEPLLAS